jgi:hypothetical protein
MRDEKVEKLFKFLKSNRKYNKKVQSDFYRQVIASCKNTNDKVISLLHYIVNTQSQPQIDKLAIFFQEIQRSYADLSSFKGFVSILSKSKEYKELTYENVFTSLKNKSGWGDKTAALFVKSIYHLHNGEYDEDIKLWHDAPNNPSIKGNFHLPVDAVIICVFDQLNILKSRNFQSINEYLSKNYRGKDMEVWDDLWFWGFITQRSNREKRTIEWNANKYWALLHTSKDERTIKEIKIKAEEFMDILKH